MGCCTMTCSTIVGSKTHHTFFSVLYPDIPANCPSVAELQAGNCNCAEDEYVSSNACVSCPPGTTNAAGDDPLGDDTSCIVAGSGSCGGTDSCTDVTSDSVIGDNSCTALRSCYKLDGTYN